MRLAGPAWEPLQGPREARCSAMAPCGIQVVESWYEDFHRRCRSGGGPEGSAGCPRPAPGHPARDRPGGRSARAGAKAGSHATRAPWEGPRRRSRETPPPPHRGPGAGGPRGQPSLNAVDSSVVVAAFASWHESHTVARRVVDRRPRLVAHCALEAYSVLTRLPAPYRATGVLVVAFLDDRFREDPLTLAPRVLRQLPGELQRAGLVGGAVYDGLVAMTAVAHRATLVTLDRRADATYRRCGVRTRFLDGATG